MVRIMRLLRLTRGVRILRLIRFCRELRMMIFSILNSGSLLCWAFLMLGVTIYVFSVYFTEIVAFHLYSSADRSSRSNVQLQDMFGSLVQAAYTLYQAVS